MSTVNKRTAALLLIEDLEVIKCTIPQSYTRAAGEKLWTFVIRREWYEGELVKGNRLLVQNKACDGLYEVLYDHTAEITDLDFDDEGIQYRFAVGRADPVMHARAAGAEKDLINILKSFDKQRVADMREQARAMLSAHPMLDNKSK